MNDIIEQHSGESVSKKIPNGSSGLASFIIPVFVLSMARRF